MRVDFIIGILVVMPAKKQPAKKQRIQHADDEALTALVDAIEGKVNKKGMTKLQAKRMEEKHVLEAVDKLQGRSPAFTQVQVCEAVRTHGLMQKKAIEEAQYVNEPVALSAEHTEWHEIAEGTFIRYEQFDGSDSAIHFIVKLFTKELTEPYSSFTYQYFVFGWPDLCVTVYGVKAEKMPDSSVVGERVGAVVSRVSRKGPGMPLRGYVAMFAVVPEFRGFRLGARMVALTVELMRAKRCDEVYLETPTSNVRALSLYTSLGLVKTKFLPRYYLDHSDAVRLKLWLKDALPSVKPAESADAKLE